jgi:hypothetical protein
MVASEVTHDGVGYVVTGTAEIRMAVPLRLFPLVTCFGIAEGAQFYVDVREQREHAAAVVTLAGTVSAVILTSEERWIHEAGQRPTG